MNAFTTYRVHQKSRWPQWFAIAALFLTGCPKDPPPPVYRVTFHARSDDKPLEGVNITGDGEPMGITGPLGTLQLDLSGKEGTVIQVQAQCPQGYRPAETIPPLKLKTFQGLDPATAEQGLQVSISCPPLERLAVVVIRTKGQTDLPVTMRGREIARTDEDGVAHVLIKMAPESTFRLELNTSDRPKLQPQNPGATFTVPDEDHIFLYDQPFEIKADPKKPKAKRPPPAPLPELIN